MKKLFFITVLAVFASTTFAQTSFGIQVGGNLASSKLEATDAGVTTKLNTDPKIGFLAGVIADVSFGNSINFRPELNFIQKGFKYDVSGDKINATLNYIELPLNFTYNVPAGSGTVFFGLGPDFGLGISGKSKETMSGSAEVTRDIKFDGKKDATDDKEHLKAFDFGADILAGYKMTEGVFVSVGYTFGFTNIAPDAGSSFKNIGGLFLKLGYNFGGAESKK